MRGKGVEASKTGRGKSYGQKENRKDNTAGADQQGIYPKRTRRSDRRIE